MKASAKQEKTREPQGKAPAAGRAAAKSRDRSSAPTTVYRVKQRSAAEVIAAMKHNGILNASGELTPAFR